MIPFFMSEVYNQVAICISAWISIAITCNEIIAVSKYYLVH
jgi:hypothetical protein